MPRNPTVSEQRPSFDSQSYSYVLAKLQEVLVKSALSTLKGPWVRLDSFLFRRVAPSIRSGYGGGFGTVSSFEPVGPPRQ